MELNYITRIALFYPNSVMLPQFYYIFTLMDLLCYQNSVTLLQLLQYITTIPLCYMTGIPQYYQNSVTLPEFHVTEFCCQNFIILCY